MKNKNMTISKKYNKHKPFYYTQYPLQQMCEKKELAITCDL